MPVVRHKTEFLEMEGHGRCEVLVVPKLSSVVEHQHYTKGSFTHPAKMSTMLCRELIRRYTKPGELMLDPMAGISATQIEAALLGRNAIGVELEKKFVDISRRNIKRLDGLKTPKGRAEIVKGDARSLSKLLRERADVAVFSPPFGDAEHHS